MGSGIGSPRPHLGETTIKVPAPFAGVGDLGFTAQYRAQGFNEPIRDVPLLFEGPEPQIGRLAELLRLLTGERQAHEWTQPVLLCDGVVVLAYRDRSLSSERPAELKIGDHVANLVRPVVFTFLEECATVARLRLSELIEMRVSSERTAFAEITMPLRDIVQQNGERLLY
ncbi:MAG: hypothetical protein ACHQ0J_11020 [Candidatus Dormibacterales bacterium]